MGLDARRLFFKIVALHSVEVYAFPPPFNLMSGVFVKLPCAVVYLFSAGRQELDLKEAKKWIWRTMVAPATFGLNILLWFFP